ncbi:hypothetical protein [Halobacterium wangiae]|uniref:hypothetical protein n=1 Tax=Halobacterium wangiae TaxID=2902623 RepID=UPI001E434DE1|nr:hypothetical protein [Halobacterium wangiae]
MTDTNTRSEDAQSPLTDPDSLRERDDVVVEEVTRPMPDEKFEALRERYDAIAGVVQVGLTHEDAVLLWGEESAAPPGGSVDGGEDWVAAARDAMEDLTGQQVEIDDPLLLEVTHFARESDESETFPAPSVHFGASLVDPDPAFVSDPSAPEDFEHPMFEDPPQLQWVEAVTDAVDENHAHHVDLYLD